MKINEKIDMYLSEIDNKEELYLMKMINPMKKNVGFLFKWAFPNRNMIFQSEIISSLESIDDALDDIIKLIHKEKNK